MPMQYGGQGGGLSFRLFKGLAPILMKQVPYTVVQLTTFQLTTDFAYNSFLPRVTGKSKEELSTTYARIEFVGHSVIVMSLVNASSAISMH